MLRFHVVIIFLMRAQGFGWQFHSPSVWFYEFLGARVHNICDRDGCIYRRSATSMNLISSTSITLNRPTRYVSLFTHDPWQVIITYNCQINSHRATEKSTSKEARSNWHRNPGMAEASVLPDSDKSVSLLLLGDSTCGKSTFFSVSASHSHLRKIITLLAKGRNPKNN